MKTKNPLKLGLILFSSLLLTATSVGVISNSNNPIEVEVGNVENKEATHVSNYSDYTYSGSYYSGINIASKTDGYNGTLRQALTSLCMPVGYHKYSSDDANTLSYVLQEADEDPTNSSNMIMFYTRNSVTKTKSNSGNTWNREHVWCQSLSNNNWGESKAGTDIFHIRPEYPSVNSSRGNIPFGEVPTGTQKTYSGMNWGYVDGQERFEPLDANKGDIARTIMYLYTVYNPGYTNKLDILDIIESYDTLMSWHISDKPDVLEGNRNDYVESSTNQKNRNPFVDNPNYAWHIFGESCSASVLSQAKQTYPDITTGSSGGDTGGDTGGSTGGVTTGASGTATYTIDSRTSVTASGTIPTGSSATFNNTYANNKQQLTNGNSMTLTLSGYQNKTIKSIEMSMKSNASGGAGSLNITAGSTTLRSFSAPFNNSNWNGAYSSTFVDVDAKLTNTDYTIKSGEKLTITIAATANSLYCESFTVTYVDSTPTKTLSSISCSGMTTTFEVGDTYVFDGVCTAYYTDSSSKTVTPTSYTTPDMTTAGSKTAKVIYTEGAYTKSYSYTVTVTEKAQEPEVDTTIKTATYGVASTSSVTTSGTVPSGSSASYSSTYGTKYQVIKNNSMTLTLNGYQNTIIKGITLSMRSNASSGAGSLNITAGSTTLRSFSAPFNNSNWNGAYSSTFVDVDAKLTNTDYTIKSGEKLTITIAATANSLYCESFTIQYQTVGSSTPSKALDHIEATGMTTTFNVGDTFVFDGTCTAYYTDDTSKTVTPSYTAPNMTTSGTKTVTLYYTEDSVTDDFSYTITVNEQAPDSGEVAGGYYQKVTTAPSDWSGKYLIVYEAGNLIFDGGLSTLDKEGNKYDVTISNSTIQETSEIANKYFTIAKYDNGYSVQSASGFYIGSTSYTNQLLTSSSTKYENTISLSSGNAVITGSGETTLKYNNNTNSGTRFRFYKSGQQAIALYKYVAAASEPDTSLSDAQAWATSFLSNVTCNNGVTAPNTTKWNSMATSYSSLTADAKSYLVNADYELVGSTVTAVGGTDQTIAEAAARYDYIVTKYGSTKYQGFITNRDIQNNLSNTGISVIRYNNEGVLLMVILVASSILPCAFIYFINKKKKR